MKTIIQRSLNSRMAILALTAALGGCASEHYRRGDGVTDMAGDSIAANTAMQMVDPWPEGVDDPDIDSPYVRPAGLDDDGGAPVTPAPVAPSPQP